MTRSFYNIFLKLYKDLGLGSGLYYSKTFFNRGNFKLFLYQGDQGTICTFGQKSWRKTGTNQGKIIP